MATVLLLVALTLGVWGTSAFADMATLLTGTPMTVSNCASAAQLDGTLRITRTTAGGNQFRDNAALTVSGSAAGGKITVSGTGNAGTGVEGSTYTVSFTTTVAIGTPSGPHTVSVQVSGAKQGNGTVNLTAGDVAVAVSCDVAPPTVNFGAASVSVPADLEVDGVVGAKVNYVVSATDDQDTSPVITCDQASGSFFAVGAHTVKCTAKDASGKTSAVASLPVTVSEDTTKPVVTITPAGPRTVPATTMQGEFVGTTVDFTAKATDNVSPAPAATCDRESGSFFAVGSHTVTCSATDTSGRVSDPATLDIEVSADGTAPVVTMLPADPVTLEADRRVEGVPGAIVSYEASASDDIDPTPDLSCDTPSGSFLPVGDHEVRCDATDGTGNAADQVVLFVTVVPDATKPVVGIVANGPVSLEANSRYAGVAGASVDFTVSATDALDGALTPTCSHTPGFFAVGATTVRCTAKDAAGNTSAEATLSIDVAADQTGPIVTTDPDQPLTLVVDAERDNVPGRVVTFTAQASDAVDGMRTASCVPVSGSFFGVGQHVVTCSATDASGNPGSASLTITIEPDTTAPVLSLPTVGALEATGPDGRAVPYTATATDDSSGTPTVVCIPASNSTFAIGQTTVECDATDATGNLTEGSFVVEVVDSTGPDMEGPAGVTVEATGPDGAPATFAVSADDLVSGDRTVSCTPVSGSVFAVGSTDVTCSAEDATGNLSTHEVTVRVVDTTAPVVSAPAGIVTQATADAGAVISFVATATDLVDGFLLPNCAPASGDTFPVGQTTVICSITDDAGNTGQASFVVTVQAPTPDVDVMPRTPGPPSADPVITPPPRETDRPPTPPDVPDVPDVPAPAPAPAPGEPSAPVDQDPDPDQDEDQDQDPDQDTGGGTDTGTAPREVSGTSGGRGVGRGAAPSSPRADQRSDTDQPDGTAAAIDDTTDGDDGENASGDEQSGGSDLSIEPRELEAGAVVDEDGRRIDQTKPGGRFRFVAGGFAPDSWVTLELHSDPVHLGRVQADGRGVVDVELTLADDVPIGEHHVVARGTDPSGRARELRVGLLVVAPIAARPPVAALMAAGAAALVLLAGVRTAGLGRARARTVTA